MSITLEPILSRFADFHLALANVRVAIDDDAEIMAYLDAHLDMVNPTEVVCVSVRQEFGVDAHVTLKVYRDPEIEDRFLMVRLRLPAYPPDTLERIRAFSHQFETLLVDKSGDLLVTTDFAPVR